MNINIPKRIVKKRKIQMENIMTKFIMEGPDATP